LRYLFEDYSLDTDRRELRCGSEVVRVTAQVFDLLVYLIRNRDRVVSKDDLISAIWAGRIISDSALTTRLNVVRNTIGDSGAEQRLLKTLPRKGFRFVGAIREDDGRAIPSAGDVVYEASRHILTGKPSIAVLPFTNMSAEPDQEFLGDGIAEDVLTELSKLRWLLVVARNSSFTYKEKAVDVRRVSRELGVRYVLEGSVRQAARRVRVTGQLIDATTGAHVWSGRYDRDLADIFAVQDEIALAVAAAIAPAIVDAERQRAVRKLPESLGAWEAYQRGLWHMTRHNAADNELAATFFQRAINLEPSYASAYGGLAWSYMAASSVFGMITIAESCRLCEPLARKAIALDENDAEVRARLALAVFLKGDIEGAIQEAERALTVNENCADAFGVKGAALVFSGRRQEGREAIQQYLRLSPRDPARPVRLAQIAASLYLDGDYEGAVLTARQVIREYPSQPIAHRWLAASLGQLGRTAEAQGALQSLLETSPSTFDVYVRQRPPQFRSLDYAHMLEGLRKAGWKD
jgi:TolB-like protein/cytochrome c-type biogenesis protein CcmH/NrfG